MEEKAMRYQVVIRRARWAALCFPCALGANIAQANDQVQLYGAVDAFAGSMRVSGQSHGTAVVNSSGLTTSYWGLKGRESLGNSLSAEFALESFFRTDSGRFGRYDGDTFFGRNAYVGLSSSYGTLKLGRNTTPWFISMLLFNPLGDSEVFSPMFLQSYTTPPGSPVNRTIAGDTAWNNSVLYQSPGFGGLRFNLLYATGEEVGHQGKQNYGGNITYFSGDFAASVAVQRVSVNAPEFSANGAAYQMAYLLGSSYDFRWIKLHGQYARADNHYDANGSQDNKTMQLGFSSPILAGTLLSSWARTWQGSGVAQQSARRDTVSIAYDYPFSKRTDVYVAWRYDKVTHLNAGNSAGLGLRHKF
ncbi:porin [Cupriavidus sp. amp6]|uniref:porin n=1 Tax=Cupriavidus sp. amp6 TaxID=388051 RepID=UPI001E4B8DB4|nr:porin [Cupriavidus sp. amp6]